MGPDEALDVIDATLRERGFREIGPGRADYEGAIRVHGAQVDVRLHIPDVRFIELPEVHLRDRLQVSPELLAHVETRTGICYASQTGLPIDMFEPGEAILLILSLASRTLETSYAGGALRDVIDEYQAYWREKGGVRFLARLSHETEKLQLSKIELESGQPNFVVHTQGSLAHYTPVKLQDVTVRQLSTPLGPTQEVRVPSTLAELEQWYCQQAGLNGSGWPGVLRDLANQALVFFDAPNALIGASLCMPTEILAGVKKGSIRRTKLPQFIEARKATIAIDRYEGTRSDLDSITSRNIGMSSPISELDIALVGGGTIGGYLAKFIVQSGGGAKGRFRIYDDDILKEGNLGRHLLPYGFLGMNKARALKAELERFHPDLEIEAVPKNALRDWTELRKFNIIVDATGDWNVQNVLNAEFLNARSDTLSAMLHCWVFMNGAGAQSFLNLADDFACFRCLRPKLSGGWRYPAGDERDELNTVPATCGEGSYIPFSVDASVTAAALANKALLDWASGQPGPRLRSAITNHTRGRYQKYRSPEPSKHCPACAHLRGGGE